MCGFGPGSMVGYANVASRQAGPVRYVTGTAAFIPTLDFLRRFTVDRADLAYQIM